MSKCYIQNLGMIVTDKCNLDCAHCLRGCKRDNFMSDEIIYKTLEQVIGVGNLSIMGGEPTLAIDRIEKIINSVIENNIRLDLFTITINGTIYSKDFLLLLDEISKYMNDDQNCCFAISTDRYHIDELNRLGLIDLFKENLAKYMESKYFFGFRNPSKKFFREGNAVHLDNNFTVPLRPLDMLVTYVGDNKKFNNSGLCNIGPLISVNTNGIVTQGDASIANQETIYNYGNILNDSIENIALLNGKLIEKPKTFERSTARLLKRYQNYNR